MGQIDARPRGAVCGAVQLFVKYPKMSAITSARPSATAAFAATV
jgi:hypothetical protein